MHPCLRVDEILRILASELVASGTDATAVALACCCKTFEDPVLDTLWETQDRLLPLLKSLPGDVWKVEANQFSFNRIPTKAEWSRFRKYARGIRVLKVDTWDLIGSEVLLALQFRTGDEPLLPRLEVFACTDAGADFIQFIPIFLSPRTTHIRIKFAPDPPTVLVALTIARFPILCPRIRQLILDPLPRDPAMIEAVSEMLLACNRDTLRSFYVPCPLTEEARRVLCTLPKLRQLWAIIQGQTSLPLMVLPDLEMIYVEWDSGRDWLRGFRGATIGRLKTAIFRPTPGSAQIGNFIEEFQTVALTASAQHSLSEFFFYTSQSWTPNYPPLLVFTQMTKLWIETSCRNGCLSTVDNDIVTSLAQAMPKLEILQLGDMPCGAPTGVTLKGLVALARHCRQLSSLCIHLQAMRLAEETTSTEPPSAFESAADIPWSDCALTDLQVGQTPVPERKASAVALALLQIFPRILNVGYANQQWKSVAETIKLFRRVCGHVHHARNTAA